MPYYGPLATIFGSSVATGQYAKSSNEPLATGQDVDEENEGLNGDNHVSPAAKTNGDNQVPPAKKAKVAAIKETNIECLVGAFERHSSTSHSRQ